MGNFKKLLSYSFAVLLFLVNINISISASANQAKQEELLDLIQTILNSSDLNTVVLSIESLKEQHYSELGYVALELAMHELRHRKNKRILEVLIETIAELGDRKLIFPFRTAVESGESPFVSFNESFLRIMRSDPKFSNVFHQYKGQLDFVKKQLKDQNHTSWPKLYPKEEKLDLYSLLKAIEAREQIRKEEVAAIEQDGKTVTGRLQNYKFIERQLIKDAGTNYGRKEIKAGDSTAVEIILAGTVRYVTDDVVNAIIADNNFPILAREDVIHQLLMVFSRYKQQNAILVGSKGSGKTSVVDGLAYGIVTGEYDLNEITEFLKDAIILQTSSARISRLAKSDKPSGQADAMEAYFRAVRDIQEKYKRRVIVFIDEIHTLSPEQVESIKPYIESSSSKILLIGASTSQEFRNSFKQNDAFLRRLELIAVRDFSSQEILNIFKNSWMKILARHPGLKVSDNVKRLIIDKARLVYPEKGPLDGAFVFTDHLAGTLRYENTSGNLNITEAKVYKFIQDTIHLPVDTRNFKKMEDYRQGLVSKIKDKISGQDRMVDDVVDLWMSVLRNESSRGVRVGMLLGRSGTGKTETAKQLAMHAFGSLDKLFIIKANQYSDANDIKMSTLVGVPGGVSFGKHTSGRMMDWLDDPSKGKYAGIILIDEGEKANLLFWETLMELFEEGYIEGGDNKIRTLNRHLILLTSNMGDKEVFPDDVVDWTEKQVEERLSSWTEEKLRALFEDFLPDAIVNRIDMVTSASVILRSIAKVILQKEMQSYVDIYEKRSGLKIEIDPEFIELLLVAYDPMKHGARNMMRGMDLYLKGAIENSLGALHPYKKKDVLRLSPINDVNGELKIRAQIGKNSKNYHMPRMEVMECKNILSSN